MKSKFKYIWELISDGYEEYKTYRELVSSQKRIDEVIRNFRNGYFIVGETKIRYDQVLTELENDKRELKYKNNLLELKLDKAINDLNKITNYGLENPLKNGNLS